MFKFKESILLFAVLASMLHSTALADVRSAGDVNPVPNENGGTINGTLAVGDGLSNGDTFIASMSINGGTVLTSTDGLVGNRRGANGTVRVSGLGSQWFNTDDVLVGNDGYGELYITSEGRVGNTDDFSIGGLAAGRGWVEVSGGGSIMNVEDVLAVGGAGFGNLLAEDNGRVVSRIGSIGVTAGSIGIAMIDERASWRLLDDLAVGVSGNGSLSIMGGGLVENSTGRIASGSNGSGQAIVNGLGSVWLNRSNLIVGDRGAGSLAVEDDGLVLVQNDVTVRANGRIQLDGGRLIADDVLNDGAIEGSGRIEGTLTNRSGGSIRGSEDSTLLISSSVTNQATIDAVGGQIEFGSTVTNQATGRIVGRDGTLRFNRGLTNSGKLGFSAGKSDIFGTVSSDAAGVIQVGGEGVATFYGDVTNSGTIEVEPEAHLVFLGDLSLVAGAQVSLQQLESDPFENNQPSINDPIIVGGQLELNGTLNLTSSGDPLNPSEPTERGTSIEISLISAGAISGAFEQFVYDGNTLTAVTVGEDGKSFQSLDGDSLPGTFRSVSYSANSVDLTNYLAVQGDTDGDRDVDFADFLTFSSNFGQPGTWLTGDFDGDGVVMFPDFLTLSGNFGTAVAASAQAVPEPSTYWLLACGTLLIVRRPRIRG